MNATPYLWAAEIERLRPRGWEFLWFATLLQEGITPVLHGYEQLHLDAGDRPKRKLDALESCDFCDERLRELLASVPTLSHLLSGELPRAWGPLGEPGDPQAIRQVARRVLAECEALLVWELKLATVEPDPRWAEMFAPLQWLTEPWIEQIAALPAALCRLVAEEPQGAVELLVEFNTPALEDLPVPRLRPLLPAPKESPDTPAAVSPCQETCLTDFEVSMPPRSNRPPPSEPPSYQWQESRSTDFGETLGALFILVCVVCFAVAHPLLALFILALCSNRR